MIPQEQQTRETYRNTNRDVATTGKSQRAADPQAGLAAEDTPEQRPPETNPEPRPVEPTLSSESDATAAPN